MSKTCKLVVFFIIVQNNNNKVTLRTLEVNSHGKKNLKLTKTQLMTNSENIVVSTLPTNYLCVYYNFFCISL